MSLSYAILGILQEQPMSGYDLKNTCFDRAVSHLWSADQAQIYRTLDKLVEDGYATCTIEIQHDHPNRKVYTITAAGEADLMRWLREPKPLTAMREPFLLQLFFGSRLSNEELVQLLEQRRDLHQERLAAYERLNPPALDDPKATRSQILRRLTLEKGLVTQRTAINQLDETIKVVRNLKPQSDAQPSFLEDLADDD